VGKENLLLLHWETKGTFCCHTGLQPQVCHLRAASISMHNTPSTPSAEF